MLIMAQIIYRLWQLGVIYVLLSLELEGHVKKICWHQCLVTYSYFKTVSNM